MTGAEEPEKTPEDGIEVEAEVVLDDGAIEVLDDEIEVAAELPARPTQPSPSSSTGVIRSRPPIRPSGRPRSPSSHSALPPPRVSTGAEPASGWPPSSRPSSSDPWLLANKTLELSRARARIADLEEQVAFRDARILTLEEKLQAAQQRLDDLEQKPGTARGAVQPGRSAAATKPVVTETRLVAAPVKQAIAPRAAAAVGSAVTQVVAPATTAGITPAIAPGVTPEITRGVTSRASTNAVVASAAELGADEEEADELEDDSASSSELGADGIDAARSSEESPEGDAVESDLRQISGIGPRFEAALRKQGITRLSQVAAWSDADVRQVAKALKIPKSRIVKGRWVEAAREAMGTQAASE